MNICSSLQGLIAIKKYRFQLKNVAFGLKMRKVSKTEIKKRVTKALELVSLNGLENRNIKELSGGQQQRVALSSVSLLKKLG